MIFPGRVSSITFSFGMFFPLTQTRIGPGSVVFTGVAEFINASYSITTVSFRNSAHLNGTVIDCNHDFISYIFYPGNTNYIDK